MIEESLELRRGQRHLALARRGLGRGGPRRRRNLVAAIAKGRTSAALLTALEKAEAQLAKLEARRAGMTPIAV